MKKVKKVTKKFDKLGRVVIPKEIRDKFDLNPKDAIEIFVDNDKIFFQKYQESCMFCNNTKNLKKYMGKYICEECKKKIKNLTMKK